MTSPRELGRSTLQHEKALTPWGTRSPSVTRRLLLELLSSHESLFQAKGVTREAPFPTTKIGRRVTRSESSETSFSAPFPLRSDGAFFSTCGFFFFLLLLSESPFPSSSSSSSSSFLRSPFDLHCATVYPAPRWGMTDRRDYKHTPPPPPFPLPKPRHGARPTSPGNLHENASIDFRKRRGICAFPFDFVCVLGRDTSPPDTKLSGGRRRRGASESSGFFMASALSAICFLFPPHPPSPSFPRWRGEIVSCKRRSASPIALAKACRPPPPLRTNNLGLGIPQGS